MKARLFFGVPVDVEDIARFLLFREKITTKNVEVKWVPPQNLHLTVLFLGETDLSLLPAILLESERITLGHPPFSLEFEKYSVRYKRHRPVMIWARYKKEASFTRLVHVFQSALKEICIPVENGRKAPVPHVTLARMKKAGQGAKIVWQDVPALPPFSVSEVVLYRSITGGKASTYIPLATFPLFA